MSTEIILYLLINTLIISILVFIYKAKKQFFVASILILLLIIFIIPEFLIPSEVWEFLLKR